MSFLSVLTAIVQKELLTELRSRELIGTMLVFALILVVIFAFSFDLKVVQGREASAGILWVAFAFAGILGLARSFHREFDSGSIQGLLLAPIDRSLIYLGKLLSNFIFLVVAEVIILLALIVLLNLQIAGGLGWLALTLLLGTWGYVAVGTFISAVAANMRLREVLMPILLFPLIVPVIIGAVKATNLVFWEQPTTELAPWLVLLVAYDFIFTVMSFLIFDFVVEG